MYKITSFKSVYILILVALMSSCALTSFQTQKTINTTQIVPLPVNKQTQSIIVLARPFKYSQALINYIVSDNENTVGLISNNSYMIWETNAGKVTLILKPSVAPRCYTNDDNCLNKNIEIANIKPSPPVTKFTFNVISGNTYYLTVNPQWNSFTDIPGKVDIVLSDNINLAELKSPVINIE